MIFSEKSIKDILSGKKTITRRLVKEGEYLDIVKIRETKEFSFGATGVKTNKGKTKWVCGHPETQKPNYAVQSGRGKKGLWYCPKCKKVLEMVYMLRDMRGWKCGCNYFQIDGMALAVSGGSVEHFLKKNKWLPLRVVVTGIRKERLMEMPFEDLAKEGYDDLLDYLGEFCRLNKFDIEEIAEINPFVWVLSVEVMK